MQDIAAPGISRRGTGHRRPGRHAAVVRWALMAVPGAALAVVAVGGFGFGWSWTGFQGNQDLWDVLHLLVLPLALTLVPFWYSTTGRLHPVLVAVLGLVAVGFVVTVVGGYALTWTWTGFPGNTLWDWLELCLVPFVVPVVVTWLSARRPRELES
jgi:hypothetical protein